ncbi:MAG: hypothetical protein WKG03_22210 [Telluria sp.]
MCGPEPVGDQGILGAGFDAIRDTPLPAKKTTVAAHEPKATPVGAGAGASRLVVDDQRLPVEVIGAPNVAPVGVAQGPHNALESSASPLSPTK